jgi:hypothetical protein
LFVSLSIYIYLSLQVCLYLHLSLSLYIYIYIYKFVSICLVKSKRVQPELFVSLSISNYLSLSLSFSLSFSKKYAWFKRNVSNPNCLFLSFRTRKLLVKSALPDSATYHQDRATLFCNLSFSTKKLLWKSVQQNNLKTVKMVVLISFHFWRENNRPSSSIFSTVFKGKNIFLTFLKK